MLNETRRGVLHGMLGRILVSVLDLGAAIVWLPETAARS
jgi:hypothetical protein